MFLIYDTETTGLPKSYTAPMTDTDNWPRMVQVAWQLHDAQGKLIRNENYIVYPDGYDIPFNVSQIHGITTEKAKAVGVPLQEVLHAFLADLAQTKVIVGHNITFDKNVLGAELHRMQMDTTVLDKTLVDTMKESVDYCAIPGGRGGKYKFAKLEELYAKLFGTKFDEAHNASADVNATARAFFELVRLRQIKGTVWGWKEEEVKNFLQANPDTLASFPIQIDKQVADFKAKSNAKKPKRESQEISNSPYFNLHNHTAYSILTSTSKTMDLVQQARKYGMPAVGMIDFGNLMGAFHFLNDVAKSNSENDSEIIPIIGCEFFVAEKHTQTKFTKENPDRRFNQVVFAKNYRGFQNLAKLSSLGYIEGLYAGYPRISKELLVEHKESLIFTTGSIYGEVPKLILDTGEAQAEQAFLWWKEQFGEDFYVQLNRHDLPEENHVNEVLIRFARKHGVKMLAQNESYYIHKEDAEAQDILICVRDNEKKATPKGRGRDKRFGMPNDMFYFRSQDEMRTLFADLPEAIDNLTELLKQFEPYTLKRNVLLPKFDIPKEFQDPKDLEDGGIRGENAYLRHLTFVGAKKRYPEITAEIRERLDFELETIANTGYPGYFLIVQDFTTQARKMGVSVGPGRGSAAGSAVAYCTGITNVDPIKYELLFERFLNPDRVSLPDIDIDFDDRGRDKIIEWVVNKYGKERVSQIITYGTMAGKSAIRDTGRALALPLPETDRLAKKVHTKLNKILDWDESKLKSALRNEEYADTVLIREMAQKDSLEGETLQQAKILEGSIRNTGIHACGVIITPEDLTDLVPMAVAKDSDLLVTQFDNAVVESAGLLKMDFLGLRTLTIIADALDLIEERHGKRIDPDEIPLDDKKTFELFQAARTVGIFQYESEGMQKHLRDLKPDRFDDLIAMNALYRPGPIKYIPNYINRKHGIEEISYDLPEMQEFLEATYGITVYQEQVMLLSQKLAGFSKGQADVLRKAMGKKQRSVLDNLKETFLEGATANGHAAEALEKIWTDWEAFAEYAFNKSHSTCYALIGYHTAYLKAHYPAEFMASVLSNNMSNIKSVTFFMSECKRMGVPVLGPSVNESAYRFSVNDTGAIRFGLGAIKGVGANAVASIVANRTEEGKYQSIFDFAKRLDYRNVNKKAVENLVLGGAFDEVDDYHRAQLLYKDSEIANLEAILKYGQDHQKAVESAQTSLFGGMTEGLELVPPSLRDCPEWTSLQKLNREKEVIGIYLSGHPLDNYATEIENFQSFLLANLKDNEDKLIGKELQVAGIVTQAAHRTAKNGKEFGTFVLEDFSGAYEFRMFGDDYLKFKHFLDPNLFLFVRLSVSQNRFTNRVFVNVVRIELLANVLKSQAKKLTLRLPAKELTAASRKSLMELIESIPGDRPVVIDFLDDEGKPISQFMSSTHKIAINREAIAVIQKMGFQFKLN